MRRGRLVAAIAGRGRAPRRTAAASSGSAAGQQAGAAPPFSDVQAEIIDAAQELPTSGRLDVNGTETTAVCSQIYDRFNESNPLAPYETPDCNYTYVSASRKYWKQLSPILVDAYGDSLGLEADDNSNGPHITVDTPCCGAVVFGSEKEPLKLALNSRGKLDATGLRRTIRALFGSESESNFVASDDTLTEPIVGAPFDVHCHRAWVGTQRKPLPKVAVESGSYFTCNAQALGSGRRQGNIYPTVNLLGGADDDGTVDAYIDVWEAYESELPRRDPNGSYALNNVILPVETPEATSRPKVSWDLPAPGSDCATAAICPQLWVVDNLDFDYSSGSYETDSKQPCTIWGVLEVESDAISGPGGFMDKYGLDTDGFNAHVSLAQSYGNAYECALAEQLADAAGSSVPPRAPGRRGRRHHLRRLPRGAHGAGPARPGRARHRPDARRPRRRRLQGPQGDAARQLGGGANRRHPGRRRDHRPRGIGPDRRPRRQRPDLRRLGSRPHRRRPRQRPHPRRKRRRPPARRPRSRPARRRPGQGQGAGARAATGPGSCRKG